VRAHILVEESRERRMVGREAEALDLADEAAQLIGEALGIDPEDVGALLALATLTRNGWTREMAAQPLTPSQRAALAAQLVRRALMADPNDPSALAAMGDYMRRWEWRWKEAENLLRKAIAIDPNLVEARWSYAYMLGTQSRAQEALVHARALARLDPETAWRRVALPRILYVAGNDAEVQRLYDRELRLAPDNLFLIRELYFMLLTEYDSGGLRMLASKLEDLWRGRKMPKGVAALRERILAGADAVEGRPSTLIAMVDKDVEAFDAPATGPQATRQGRASVDFLYIYAMEYAWAGHSQRALELLSRALEARSVYWPATLPYGRAQFPPDVRKDPRYAAVWRKDPNLWQLVQTRLQAVRQNQAVGVLPDGRRIRPQTSQL
jgi:tetratricopeptide (TPR) repeat protein